MKRIHAFGCSLTAQHNWRYLEDVNVTSYAVAGGSHNMQLVSYGNGRHAETIGRDDIIIWQITDPRRHAYNVTPENLAETKKFKYSIRLLKRKDSVSKHNAGRLVTENIYTGKEMDMVTNHFISYWFEGDNIENYSSIVTDMAKLEDNIYSLLWSLNGIKRTNTKLLVVFGWDIGLPDGCKDKMINFFGLNSIATIEPSILDWTLEQGYEQSSTSHPNEEGYKAFTEEVLEPKLKSLGWI